MSRRADREGVRWVAHAGLSLLESDPLAFRAWINGGRLRPSNAPHCIRRPEAGRFFRLRPLPFPAEGGR